MHNRVKTISNALNSRLKALHSNVTPLFEKAQSVEGCLFNASHSLEAIRGR